MQKNKNTLARSDAVSCILSCRIIKTTTTTKREEEEIRRGEGRTRRRKMRAWLQFILLVFGRVAADENDDDDDREKTISFLGDTPIKTAPSSLSYPFLMAHYICFYTISAYLPSFRFFRKLKACSTSFFSLNYDSIDRTGREKRTTKHNAKRPGNSSLIPVT